MFDEQYILDTAFLQERAAGARSQPGTQCIQDTCADDIYIEAGSF
jgi:hypothetical protein